MGKTTGREKRLHMLISEDEARMLERLAERDGATVSELVRGWIRERARSYRPSAAPAVSRHGSRNELRIAVALERIAEHLELHLVDRDKGGL
jgi:hypothetical protein